MHSVSEIPPRRSQSDLHSRFTSRLDPFVRAVREYNLLQELDSSSRGISAPGEPRSSSLSYCRVRLWSMRQNASAVQHSFLFRGMTESRNLITTKYRA